MSKENVELTRRIVEAFNSRDIEAMIALSDPSIEWHSTFAAFGGAVYHGHDGLRRWHRDLRDTWGEEIRIEPEAFFSLGEHTLMFGVLLGRGRQSGADVAMPYAATWSWRDGLNVYAKAYVHREDALKDLGVSEDALEPMAP
jgi:ketosteroid isomerase-like protein